MAKLKLLLSYYSAFIVSLALIGGLFSIKSKKDVFFIVLFLPVNILLWWTAFKNQEKKKKTSKTWNYSTFFASLITSFFLSFIVAAKLLNISYLKTKNFKMLLAGFLVFLLIGLLIKAIKKGLKSKPAKLTKKTAVNKAIKIKNKPLDINKREFLKLLGSLSLGGVLLSLFSKKAYGLTFGGTGMPDPIGIKHFSGTGADYSLTLTSADTAYQCPESSNVPSKDYILNIYNSSDTDVYWGWSSDIAGTTAKRRVIPSGGTMSIDLAGSGYLYLVCSSSSKTIAYGVKERD